MRCAFCKSDKFSKPIKVCSGILNHSVDYYKCKNCGSIRQYPLPDSDTIQQYYETYCEINAGMNPGYLEDTQLKSLFNERDMTLNEIGFDLSRIRGKSNIELGCANGHFLCYLKARGADKVTGIDISSSMIDTIDIEGVTAFAGGLCDLKDAQADNLFLFNILEHTSDPREVISQAGRCLNADGALVIEIPVAGIVSSYFGKRWRFLMPDEHLHIPSMRGIKYLLSDYGFEICGLTRFGSGFTSGTIAPFWKRLFDKSAKRFKFGDRCSMLCRRSISVSR